MKIAAIAGLCALMAYSATLLLVEWNTSQDDVRHYFTDIEGEVLFHGINTTLSAFLLAGSALLLGFAALARQGHRLSRATLFLMAQAGLFLLLAFDDRFQLHERLGYRLGVGDHYVMVVWAAAQLAILLLLCRPRTVSLEAAALFIAAGGCFVVMMIFDVFVAHDAALRLSIEDLAKTWAAALFLAASWSLARFHLGLGRTDRSLQAALSQFSVTSPGHPATPFPERQP